MENPLRSEDAAFKLVLLTVVAFGLIALGSWVNTWVGVAVVVLEVALAARLVLVWRRSARPARAQAAPQSPPGEHRVLVLADAGVTGTELVAHLGARVNGRRSRVLVVVPKPGSHLAQVTGDEGDAGVRAEARLGADVAALRAAGLVVEGHVGEIDPAVALGDAVRTFAPDELVLASIAGRTPAWGDGDGAAWARERFALPVEHVVVGDGGSARR